ncbi:sugar ABC transporter substrate-binding protein [Baekduia alba]|uniref:sugar ABC transporter substrate-binding protein n=1 Tax=Baekduia alba TaxID=2997333 RepID=UPI002340591F|nr:sugar ABC transporter substrate-binding protein [Baekduia alba]
MVTVGVLALAAVGCGSSESSSSAKGGGGSASGSVSGKKAFVISCSDEVPFCNAYNKTIASRLEAAGMKVTTLTDAFDAGLQNQHMNQAIAQHPAAIVLNASNSSAIVPAVKRAVAAGVKVVNTDAPLSSDGVASLQVVADHQAMGRFAAEGLVDGLQKEGVDKGSVFVAAGALASKAAQERVEGFKTTMAKYPQYKIVAVDDTSWDQNKATQVAAQRLAQYRSSGGIKGAYGMNDLLALGVIKAAKQAGVKVGVKQKGVVVVGGNCLAPGIPAVKDGSLYTSGTQTPVPQGDAVAKNTIALLEGQKLPPVVTVKEYKITADNVNQFAGECTF